MINHKKVIYIVGIACIILVIFFTFGTSKYRSMKVSSQGSADFQNKLKKASKVDSQIDINKLTNFKWDKCYVFTPYYPSKDAYEKVGTEWTTSKTYLGFLMSHSKENESKKDDEFLIVFKKGNKVVLSKRYNLNQLPVIFRLDNYEFTRNNAKFLVRTGNQYNKKNIKELFLHT